MVALFHDLARFVQVQTRLRCLFKNSSQKIFYVFLNHHGRGSIMVISSRSMPGLYSSPDFFSSPSRMGNAMPSSRGQSVLPSGSSLVVCLCKYNTLTDHGGPCCPMHALPGCQAQTFVQLNGIGFPVLNSGLCHAAFNYGFAHSR